MPQYACFQAAAAGYIAAEGEAVVAQPDGVIAMIRTLHSFVPALLMILIGIMAVMLSKLSKQMPQMEREIAERKMEAPADNK